MKLRAFVASLMALTIATVMTLASFQTLRAAEETGETEEEHLPDTAVLATVNDREITVGDFREAYFASDINFRPRSDEEGRIEFLNSMINKEILANTANEANKPLGFEDRLRIRETEEKTLANVLFLRRVYEPATATEEEMLEIYPQFSYRIHVRHILFDDKELAERVRRELLSGRTTWSKAVRRYSLSPNRDEDGDLGWRNRLSLRGDLGIKAFDLNPGAISEVAQNLEGFHVLQCLDREQAKPHPFKTLKRIISEDIRSARTIPLLQKYYADLSKIAEVTYDTTQIAWATAVFKEFELSRMEPHEHEGHETSAPERKLEMTAPTPVFKSKDLDRVIATLDGTPFTLREFMAGYREIPAPVRRKLLSLEPFIVTLNGILLKPKMVELARMSGIGEDPRTVAEVARKTEQVRVEHLFSDSIMSKIRLDDEELRQHYEDRKHEFVTFASALYARIGRLTEAGADSVLAQLESGTPAAEILAADSAQGFYLGSIETIRQTGSNLYESVVFNELEPGEAIKLGPDSEDKFVVVQVIEAEKPQPMSFDEVRSIVAESVRNEKAERLLKALLERQRRHCKIVSHPELVMKIRLIDPALDI